MKQLSTLTALLLLFFTASYSQDCKSSMLSAKGQELEYHNFLPKGNFFGKKNKGFIQVTTLIFQVTDVKDSAGVTYSYITKKGIAATKDFTWQKNMVITCDGKNISVPVDFLVMDTVYACDMRGGGTKKEIAFQTKVTGRTFSYPVIMEDNKPLASYSYYSSATADNRQQLADRPGLNSSQIQSQGLSSAEYTVYINGRKTAGKEQITTAAGTFDCFKITMDMDIGYKPMPVIEYYCPGTGIVKIEYPRGNYVELVRVGKAG